MWIIFNPVTSFLLACIGLFLMLSAVYNFIRQETGFGVGLGVAGLAVAIGWFVTGTNIVVSANTAVLVINQSSGQPEPYLRHPGIQGVPMFFRDTLEFPYRSDWQWCPSFSPSVRGGAGVNEKICFTIDATQVDWVSQYRRYGGGVDTVTGNWQNELTQGVADATALYVPRELTDSRDKVVKSIKDQTEDRWVFLGVIVKSISLVNWEFTDAALKTAYDNAFLSQTKVDQANFDLQAAQVEQQTSGVQADTQVQVAQKLANGHVIACKTAGMTTPELCIAYLQIIWLNDQKPSNLVVSVGNGGSNVTFPAQSNQPVSTPSTK